MWRREERAKIYCILGALIFPLLQINNKRNSDHSGNGIGVIKFSFKKKLFLLFPHPLITYMCDHSHEFSFPQEGFDSIRTCVEMSHHFLCWNCHHRMQKHIYTCTHMHTFTYPYNVLHIFCENVSRYYVQVQMRLLMIKKLPYS